MRLAFIIYQYFPFGGVQRNLRAIAEACIGRGHEVQVYTGHWDGDAPESLGVTLLPERGLMHYTRQQHLIRMAHAAIARDRIDAVVGFNKMPGLDIYYAGDSCFAAKAYEARPAIYRWAKRNRLALQNEAAVFAAGNRTHVLLVSKSEQSTYQRYYQTEPTRFHDLPPGISRQCVIADDHADVRLRTRSGLGLVDEQLCLLAVGSGFRTKGLDRTFDLLVRIADRFDAQLYVVGADKQRPFERMAERLQVSNRVHFLGGRNDVPELLQGADVLLHPAYFENTGNVLLEAMVAGLPVITTDVCGYASYVSDGQMGRVLPSPFDPAGYADALTEVLSVQRTEWQRRGRRFAAGADIYDRPRRACEIIESVCGTAS